MSKIFVLMMEREWTMIEGYSEKSVKNGSTILTFHPQGNELGRKLEKLRTLFSDVDER